MLVDTHAHIYTVDFDDDRDNIIGKAIANGIGKIFMPNIDAGTVKNLLEAEGKYPSVCFPLMGLHPNSVGPDYIRDLDIIFGWFTKHNFYGVGEIGIDLYWDTTFSIQQEDAFRQQLRLARFMKHPVVIHMRNSFREVISALEKEQDGSLHGIFHCFSGTKDEADKIIETGFSLGIGGVVTYRNSLLPDVLKETDLNNLVLETDAPWLSPVPKRGRRNESSYLIYTAMKLAEIYNMTLEEVSTVTSRNALKLFNFEEQSVG
jgi:TatD DNase family protein